MSPGRQLYELVDWTFVGDALRDPNVLINALGVALAEGIVAGAIAVALTVMYHRR